MVLDLYTSLTPAFKALSICLRALTPAFRFLFLGLLPTLLFSPLVISSLLLICLSHDCPVRCRVCTHAAAIGSGLKFGGKSINYGYATDLHLVGWICGWISRHFPVSSVEPFGLPGILLCEIRTICPTCITFEKSKRQEESTSWLIQLFNQIDCKRLKRYSYSFWKCHLYHLASCVIIYHYMYYSGCSWLSVRLEGSFAFAFVAFDWRVCFNKIHLNSWPIQIPLAAWSIQVDQYKYQLHAMAFLPDVAEHELSDASSCYSDASLLQGQELQILEPGLKSIKWSRSSKTTLVIWASKSAEWAARAASTISSGESSFPRNLWASMNRKINLFDTYFSSSNSSEAFHTFFISLVIRRELNVGISSSRASSSGRSCIKHIKSTNISKAVPEDALSSLWSQYTCLLWHQRPQQGQQQDDASRSMSHLKAFQLRKLSEQQQQGLCRYSWSCSVAPCIWIRAVAIVKGIGRKVAACASKHDTSLAWPL